jgi:putative heme-binding domain-containing protein
VEQARAPGSSDVVRQAAVDGLVLLGGRSSQDALAQLAGGDRPLGVQRMAVVALAQLDLEGAARRAGDVLAASAGDDAGPIFDAFLQRRNGATALAATLANRKLPSDVAKIGVRSVRAFGRDSPALVEALTRAGRLTTVKRELSPREMQALVAEVLKQGNAGRGEVIYRRKDQVCMKCHAIAGAGGQVGPDLTSVGASAQIDYLIESILLPNKVIKENYHSLVVSTRKGQILTGIKVRETKTELVLRDAEDREVVIPAAEIDEKANGGSLMPEGLADTLTRTELIDLVRFLAELGKVGPFGVSQARLVRRWQALEATPQSRDLLRTTRLASAAGNDPALLWAPAYSQVSGLLPLDAVPSIQFRKDISPHGFLRCQLDVTAGGKLKLVLNSTAGITLWVDGVPTEVSEVMVLELTAGVRTLTFAVDLAKRREGLRCELEDVPASPARVRIVGGK